MDSEQSCVQLPQIVAAALRVTGYTLTDLRSDRRTEPLVRVRHAVIILAIRHTTRGIAEVGRYFNRDHTTVLHVIGGLKRKITNNDPRTHEFVKSIEADMLKTEWPLGQKVDPLKPSLIPIKPGETVEDVLKMLPAAHVRRQLKDMPFIPLPSRPCVSWRVS